MVFFKICQQKELWLAWSKRFEPFVKLMSKNSISRLKTHTAGSVSYPDWICSVEVDPDPVTQKWSPNNKKKKISCFGGLSANLKFFLEPAPPFLVRSPFFLSFFPNSIFIKFFVIGKHLRESGFRNPRLKQWPRVQNFQPDQQTRTSYKTTKPNLLYFFRVRLILSLNPENIDDLNVFFRKMSSLRFCSLSF